MPQPNENLTPKPKSKELCTIRVMFQVESDEQAIEVKKKIAAALTDNPDVQMHFTLMPSPSRPPVG